MSNLWFVNNPPLLSQIKEEIKTNFPSLVVITEANKILIRGNLQIVDKEKSTMIDEYIIEIELTDNHPKDVPIVREMGGRIPRVPDRHINLDGGSICLFVPDEKWKHYPWGTTVTGFINNTVIPYFLGQSYFEQTGKILFGERPHGVKGIIDFYFDELKTKDTNVIIKFLDYLSRPKIKNNWQCYCKSNKHLKDCHIEQLLDYRKKIGSKRALESLKKIQGLA